MSATRRQFWFAAFALLLISAAPGQQAEHLIRQGNQAFDRGDFERALKLYEHAEPRSTDPGLAAFNEGATLYRLGRFAEAEAHYRRALEGAGGARQVQGLYNLGTCLLRQGGKSEQSLREALMCFEKCLLHADANAELRSDAAHNLELARLLWQEARRAGRENPPPDQETGGNPAGADQENQPAGTEPGTADPARKDRAGQHTAIEGGPKALETSEQTPGQGNLRPLPDRDDLVPLTPEDAAAYLDQAARRILQEQRAYRQAAPPAAANVKDW
jgi:Ca-activated chloride channel family protein